MEVRAASNHLVVTMPGQRHRLEPRRGLRFGLRGLSGYSVEFVLDGELATVIRFRQPEGLFAATRSE